MSVMAIVRLNAHPGKGGAICDMLNRGMLEATRGAEGLLGLQLLVGEPDRDAVVVMEEWESVEAHTRYVDSLGDSFDALMELVADRDARHYQALD